MNLCIIILGLLRTFFNDGGEYQSFFDMLLLLNQINIYKKIHIILVISGEYNKEQISKFILQMNIFNISCDKYEFNINEIDELYEIKIKNEKYLNNLEKINFRNMITKSYICQFYQLKIGIEKMLNYEIQNNIKFDICMKSRFDYKYPTNFYPLVHDKNASVIDKIFLNNENNLFFQNIFNDLQINNLQTLINIIKNQPYLLDSDRTQIPQFSFGGYYFNNFISLENILTGNDNILYMYNDFIIFGFREQFIKLSYLYDEYGIMDTTLNFSHFLSPESQLLMFCFNNNITPIMYSHFSYDILIIR